MFSLRIRATAEIGGTGKTDTVLWRYDEVLTHLRTGTVTDASTMNTYRQAEVTTHTSADTSTCRHEQRYNVHRHKTQAAETRTHTPTHTHTDSARDTRDKKIHKQTNKQTQWLGHRRS